MSNEVDMHFDRTAKSLAIVCLVLFLLSTIFGCGSDVSTTDKISERLVKQQDSMVEIDAYLAKLNDPRIIRTTIDTGQEIVNCVEIMLQHGFDNPITEPLLQPPSESKEVDSTVTAYGFNNVKRCPDGTVPQIRLDEQWVRSFGTLDAFFHRKAAPRIGSADGVQYVDVWDSSTFTHHGADAYINYWNPYVAVTGEHSIMQMWVTGGSYWNQYTVETGSMVDPGGYHDSYTHIFIFETANAYHETTPCYDQQCSNFTVTSTYLPLGSSIASSAISVHGGTQTDREHTLFKDAYNNWHFAWNGVWIGYWPAGTWTLSGAFSPSYYVGMGGEVINKETGGLHTTTDMGSGYFPILSPLWLYGNAAYIRNMTYYDVNDILRPIGSFTTCTDVTDSYCYSGYCTKNDPSWGTYMYFGGSGYNTDCQ